MNFYPYLILAAVAGGVLIVGNAVLLLAVVRQHRRIRARRMSSDS